MIETEGFRQELASVREKIKEAGVSLNVALLKEQLIEYQEDMASPGFWDNMDRAPHQSDRCALQRLQCAFHRHLLRRGTGRGWPSQGHAHADAESGPGSTHQQIA